MQDRPAPFHSDELKLQQIDSLISHYYPIHPDSAEFYCYQKIELLKSLNRLELAVETYLFLTELYEYRKPDAAKALSSITTAAQVLLDNPEVQIRNPYLFINLGNLLLQYNLYEEAILAYQQSLLLIKDMPTDIKVLAFNNIAMTYQSKQEYDSARVYFGKANKAIPNKKDILMVQSYTYINTLMLEKGQLDSIQYYHQLVEDLVPQIDMKIFEKNKSDSLKAHAEISKIRAVSILSVAQYYYLTGAYGKADSCYRKVLEMAKTNGFNRLMAKTYFKLAVIWEKQEQIETAMQFSDSALQTNLKLNDFEGVIGTAMFLSVLNARIDNAPLANKYLKLSDAFSDSLQKKTISAQVLKDKLFIAGANTKLAIKDLRYRHVMSSKIIGQQKMIIYLMLLIGLMVLMVVVFIRIFRKRLKRTNLNLARRTIEVVANESNMRDWPRASVQKPITDNLVAQLDSLLQSEKVYLDPNLTLAGLAEKLGTNMSYLSRVFNERYNIGFNDYIYELRIKETCRLLLTINDKNITIDHILSNSGFRSRSPFYCAFKKFTGVTPDVFKRLNQFQN